jgi:hypothetical protein
MTSRHTLLAALAAVSVSFAAADHAVADRTRAITRREASAFHAQLKLAEVERRFGPGRPVHGGASVYPCADKKGMEIWFVWDIPKKPSDIRRLSDFGIAFIALSSDTKFIKILWPAGMTVEQASEKNHKDLEKFTRRYPDAH